MAQDRTGRRKLTPAQMQEIKLATGFDVDEYGELLGASKAPAEAPTTGRKLASAPWQVGGLVTRVLGGIASGVVGAVPSFLTTPAAAVIGGAAESAAQKLEGKTWSEPLDKSTVGLEAGLSAVPLGKVYKVGKPLITNMLRGAGLAELGTLSRRYNERGEIAPNSVEDAGWDVLSLGLGAGGGLLGRKQINKNHPHLEPDVRTWDARGKNETGRVKVDIEPMNEALAPSDKYHTNYAAGQVSKPTELPPINVLPAPDPPKVVFRARGKNYSPKEPLATAPVHVADDGLPILTANTKLTATKGLFKTADEARAQATHGDVIRDTGKGFLLIPSADSPRLQAKLKEIESRYKLVTANIDPHGKAGTDARIDRMLKELREKRDADLIKARIDERRLESSAMRKLETKEAAADLQNTKQTMGGTDIGSIKSASVRAQVEFIEREANETARSLNAQGKYKEAQAAKEAARQKIQAFLNGENVTLGPKSVSVTVKEPTQTGSRTLRQTASEKLDDEGAEAANKGPRPAPTLEPTAPATLSIEPLDPKIAVTMAFGSREEALEAIIRTGRRGYPASMGSGRKKWRIVLEGEDAPSAASKTAPDVPVTPPKAAEPVAPTPAPVAPKTPKAKSEVFPTWIKARQYAKQTGGTVVKTKDGKFKVNPPDDTTPGGGGGTPPPAGPAPVPAKPKRGPKGPAGGAKAVVGEWPKATYLPQRNQDAIDAEAAQVAITKASNGDLSGINTATPAVLAKIKAQLAAAPGSLSKEANAAIEARAAVKPASTLVPAQPVRKSPLGMKKREIDAVTREDVKNWTPEELQSALTKWPKDKRLATIINDELKASQGVVPEAPPVAVTSKAVAVARPATRHDPSFEPPLPEGAVRVDLAGATDGAKVQQRILNELEKYSQQVKQARAAAGVDETGAIPPALPRPLTIVVPNGPTITVAPHQVDGAIERIQKGLKAVSANNSGSGRTLPKMDGGPALWQGLVGPVKREPIVIKTNHGSNFGADKGSPKLTGSAPSYKLTPAPLANTAVEPFGPNTVGAAQKAKPGGKKVTQPLQEQPATAAVVQRSLHEAVKAETEAAARYGSIKDAVAAGKATKEDLRAAGVELGHLRAEIAKRATELLETGKVSDEDVKQALERLQKITKPLKQDPDSSDVISRLPPEEQTTRLMDIVARFKGSNGKEAGIAINEALIAAGASTVGALAGAAANPDDPVTGALLGLTAGGAVFAPSAVRALISHVRGSNLPAHVRQKSMLRTAEKVQDVAQNFTVHMLPDAYRASLLTSFPGTLINAIVGPWGASLMGSIEYALAKDPRGMKAFKLLINPKNFPVAYKESWDDAKRLIFSSEERTEGVMGQAGPLWFRRATAVPAEILTAGDLAARKILMQAGFSKEEARAITLTSEPLSAWSGGLANLRRARGPDGKPSLLWSMLLPFYKTNANQIEQGVMRLPFYGPRAQRNWGVAPVAKQHLLVQQGMSIGAGGASFMLGYLRDSDDKWKDRQTMKAINNFGGQYGMTMALGFVAGMAFRDGKDPSTAIIQHVARNDLALPSADIFYQIIRAKDVAIAASNNESGAAAKLNPFSQETVIPTGLPVPPLVKDIYSMTGILSTGTSDPKLRKMSPGERRIAEYRRERRKMQARMRAELKEQQR